MADEALLDDDLTTVLSGVWLRLLGMLHLFCALCALLCMLLLALPQLEALRALQLVFLPDALRTTVCL